MEESRPRPASQQRSYGSDASLRTADGAPDAEPLDGGAQLILRLFEERLHGMMLARLEMGRALERCEAQERLLSEDLKAILALRHEERADWEAQREDLVRTVEELHAHLRSRGRPEPEPMLAPYARPHAARGYESARQPQRRDSQRGPAWYVAQPQWRGDGSDGSGSEAAARSHHPYEHASARRAARAARCYLEPGSSEPGSAAVGGAGAGFDERLRGRRPSASPAGGYGGRYGGGYGSARREEGDADDGLAGEGEEEEEEEEAAGYGGARRGGYANGGSGRAQGSGNGYGRRVGGGRGEELSGEVGRDGGAGAQDGHSGGYGRRRSSTAPMLGGAQPRGPRGPASAGAGCSAAEGAPRSRSPVAEGAPRSRSPVYSKLVRRPEAARTRAPPGGLRPASPAGPAERAPPAMRAAANGVGTARHAAGCSPAAPAGRSAPAAPASYTIGGAGGLSIDLAGVEASADGADPLLVGSPHDSQLTSPGAMRRMHRTQVAHAPAQAAGAEPGASGGGGVGRADEARGGTSDRAAGGSLLLRSQSEREEEVEPRRGADSRAEGDDGGRLGSTASQQPPQEPQQPQRPQEPPQPQPPQPPPQPQGRTSKAPALPARAAQGGAAARSEGAPSASGTLGADELEVQVSRVSVEPSHAQLALAAGLSHLSLAFDLLGAEGAASAPVRIVPGSRAYPLRLSARFQLRSGGGARAALLRALEADDQRASDVAFTLYATDKRSSAPPVAVGRAHFNLEQLVINDADAHNAELQLRELPPADGGSGDLEAPEHALAVGRITVSVRALRLLRRLDAQLEAHGSAAAAIAAEQPEERSRGAESPPPSRRAGLAGAGGTPHSAGTSSEEGWRSASRAGTPVPPSASAAAEAGPVQASSSWVAQDGTPPRVLASTRALSAASPAAVALAAAASEARRSGSSAVGSQQLSAQPPRNAGGGQVGAASPAPSGSRVSTPTSSQAPSVTGGKVKGRWRSWFSPAKAFSSPARGKA